MVFRFLVSDYESLQSILDIYAYDDKTENCVVLTEMAFPSIVTSMVIQERGLEESKKAQEMVYIKSSSMNTICNMHTTPICSQSLQVSYMVEIIKENFFGNSPQWMSQEALENARAKIDHMESIIGHPHYKMNENWLNKGE